MGHDLPCTEISFSSSLQTIVSGIIVLKACNKLKKTMLSAVIREVALALESEPRGWLAIAIHDL